MTVRMIVFLVLLASCRLHAAQQQETPNVIVIVADDLGYGDVSCYGARRIKTPNIDALAKGGLRFTDAYCTAATCTPTRYSLLTGTYAFRMPGIHIAPPNAGSLIKPGTETIASIMKRAGYATGIIGKWHLGLGDKHPDWNGEIKPGPLELGFDYCLLLPTTNDRVPQVFIENHRVKNLDQSDPLWVGDKKPSPDHPTGVTHRNELRMNWSHGHNNTIQNGIGRIGFYTGGHAARFLDEDLADAWTKRAATWIAENKKHPFFLLLTPHDIHVPRMPHKQFQGKSVLGPRGDMILEFDWTVGQITKILRAQGLTKKTIVILTSDNGPVLDDGYQDNAVAMNGDHTPAGPFKGGKYVIYEGGTRMPFIVSWPGHVAPGVSSNMVSTVDLAASLAALTGQTIVPQGCLDSLNVLPALLGQRAAKGRTQIVQQDNTGAALALREGDWKLLRFKTNGPKKFRFELYNVATDPGEKDNCATRFPERRDALAATLEALVRAGRTRPVSPSVSLNFQVATSATNGVSAVSVKDFPDVEPMPSNNIFTPTIARGEATNTVALKQVYANQLLVVPMKINNKPCNMMLDTGATHTVIDSAVAKRLFPDVELIDLDTSAGSNVVGTPQAFPVDSVTLGNTTLTNFYMAVLDLDHFRRSMMTPVDGILGANVLAYAPFILSTRKKTITWYTQDADVTCVLAKCASIKVPCARARDASCLDVLVTVEDKTFPLLVDSGASMTFVPRAKWPAASARPVSVFSVGARDTQTARQLGVAQGVPATMKFGETFAIPNFRPMLMDSTDNPSTFGMDLFQRYDVFMDFVNGRVSIIR